jgi:hypothetical protein
MKRIGAALTVVGTLALAGCGGSSANAQCAKLRGQADAWAHRYVAPFSAAVRQQYEGQLAAADLKRLAVQHRLTCR